MAITVSLYNHTALLFANGANLSTDTYTVELYSAMTFDATDTTKALVDASATPLTTQFGYTAGGQNLASVVVATVTTNDASFDAADLTWTASGGSIVASHAVLYNNTDTNDPPLCMINFDGTQTAADGADFKIVWNASGIFTFTVT